ncbi:MAG TPA: hypothetical protein VMB70_04695 [Terriglobia bacterium]|nr:hypothetical protein [Terriglobia bacterium]
MSRVRVLGICVMIAFVSPALQAQWPTHRAEGVPRKPDGAVSLDAPTPRTASGKPDLSGLWETFREGTGQVIAGADVPPLLRTSQFWNIGAGLEGDLPLRPWAVELRAKRVAEHSKDNPDAHCLPIGLTQLHNHPQPRKMIQTPSLLLMLYEANGGVRQIFMDGRPLPNNDPQPWWYGYSIGKWDGDTLVVETTGFRDDGWLDVNGAPLTDAAKVTERFRRINYGTLEIEVTVDDPKAYTRPWTAVKIRQRLLPDDELIEFVCTENEKSSQYFDK